ncbi:rCG30216 [Rattus norvegicus]|uniref:RCG30216 n=1 Tax=Rattus norvegicus TaxID=10116 RepID=A6IM24_RAT|nr:rCG30216 [Rattus norvegicus]
MDSYVSLLLVFPLQRVSQTSSLIIWKKFKAEIASLDFIPEF